MRHHVAWIMASLMAAEQASAQADSPAATAGTVTIRVATFNIHDVRTEELADPSSPRLRQLAEVIQRVRPNVLLLSEIAYDTPAAGANPDAAAGRNAQRFADAFLAVPQATDVSPLKFRAFMAATNTGAPSGMDLDHDGQIVTTFPTPPVAPGAEPSEAGRRFGNDCWGFGTFPGQYGMALLVDERLEIVAGEVRTFRLLPWDYMPGAYTPVGADGTTPWYTEGEQAKVRLSSKSHWDVPVRIPGGAVVHFLCSHPTPPAFDGPEKRNARRNHDEIRFWADYLDGGSWIVDDRNIAGAFDTAQPFVILGDLNADPDEGDSFKDPIGSLLFSCRWLNAEPAPKADRVITGLDADDTAMFGLRVDYVLPSRTLEVHASGVWRDPPILAPAAKFPSDHFPVWMDLTVPAPPK